MRKEIRFLKLSGEDYLKELNSLLKLLRSPEEKGSLDWRAILKPLKRAVFETARKLKRGEALSEHEKWIYENAHLVRRAALKYSEKSVELPSKDGEPRIVTILRFALTSTAEFSKDVLLDTLRAVKNETSLTIKEIEALPSAIAYAAAEGIAILSERVIYHNRMKYRAEKEPQDAKFFTSDIYNYYLLRASSSREKTEAALRAHGANPRGADAAFTLSVLENDELSKKFFTVLASAEEIAPVEETLKTTEVYEILSKRVSFRKMSFDTQKYYADFVADAAKRLKKDEIFVADKLVAYEASAEVRPDAVFRDKIAFLNFVKRGKISRSSNRGLRDALYFLSIFAIAAALDALTVFLIRDFFAIFLILPFFFAAEKFVNRVLSKTISHRFLPRMNFSEVPQSHKTLVAVSEYIVSFKQLKESVDRLKALKAGNGAGAVEFSLLIDFAAADEEEREQDAELIEFLKTELSEDGYNAFVRRRVSDGKRYSGRERKRGAIEDLNFMLTSGNADAFRFVLKPVEKPEYVVLLDSDNTVEPGTVLDMVNLAAHPGNASYDLLSAAGRYRLETPKTAYSKRFYREGGLMSYPHYSSFFFDCFGKELFCGKGIYRLKAYEKKLSGIFPEGKILSHDILEGALLETASGGVVYEEAPLTFAQQEERLTRWQRGDLQLLPFLKRNWKNAEGEKYRSEIPFFYRAMIVRNALCVFSPIALFAAIVLGLFLDPWLAIAGVIAALIPFLIDFVAEIRTFGEKRRPRYVLKSILYSAFTAIEEFFLLPYRAVKNAITAFGVFVKSVSGQNLLVWKTYYMSKNSSPAGIAVKMSAAPLVVCCFIALGLYFASPFALILFAAEVVMMLAALGALAAKSVEYPVKSPKNAEFLRDVCFRTLKYFDLVRGSGLPADNFQERPYRGKSAVTSPTNLGFALLAEISAFYLGYRDRDDTVKNLYEDYLKFVKLKTYKGNLYNWYSLDGAPKGSFVSSVDSGNFVACLILAKGFLEEIGENDLAVKYGILADETDLSALFDREKELMTLGIDAKTKRKTGHYDMLMSESRLTSYLEAARSQNPAVFRNLQRDYTALEGNTLMSWSGTMFEYLMPTLFLRAPESSLIRESERNSVKIQKRRRFRGLWGRSEGGYYAFDDDMNYQYYAVGEDALAIRNEPNLAVVTPYSAALAIGADPDGAVKNLRRFQKIGAYGEYGFYEAVDVREGKFRFVESYMTHHQGMLLSAVTNYLKGDILVKLMEKSPLVRSASLLLGERPSERAYPIKAIKIAKIPQKTQLEYYKKQTNIEYSEEIFALTNGAASVFGDNLGNTVTKFKKILVGKPYRTDGIPSGGFFYAETPKGFRCPTAVPISDPAAAYASGQTESELFYENASAGLKLEIRKNDNFGAITKRFTVDAPTGKQVRVAYLEELVLNEADAYLAHPVFNGMFVETSYLPEKKTIIAEKRSGKESGDRFYALSIRGMDKLKIETDRMKLIGRGRGAHNPLMIENFVVEGDADVGDVLEPAFGFSGLTELARNGKAVVEVTQFSADSMEELLKLIDTAPADFFRYAERSTSDNDCKDAFTAEFVSRLALSKRNFPLPENPDFSAIRSEFQKYNRSGKGVFYRSGQSVENFARLIRAAKCAENLGFAVFINVALPKTPDNRMKKAAEEVAKRNFYANYRILTSEEETAAVMYSAIVLDDSLQFADPFEIPNNTLASIKISDGGARAIGNESYFIAGENGGFLENGDFLLTGEAELPFSDVVALEKGGFVATENGGGFAFFGNARENKTTEFFNDPVTDAPSEIFAVGGKKLRRINRGESATRYSPGKIVWYSDYPELNARTEEYLLDRGSVRVLEAEITLHDKNAVAYYGFRPALDWKAQDGDTVFYETKGILEGFNFRTGSRVAVKFLADNAKSIAVFGKGERLPYFRAELEGKEHRLFVLVSEDAEAIRNLNPDAIASKKTETARLIESYSPVTISTGDDATDVLFNRWLMPQIRFSRLNARAGYYQAGGAVGFRDQLQDVVALLSTDPERVREQILGAARHQYEEGDVQHWWHPPRFGNRTRITDDKLFLVLLTGKYLRATGDKSILYEELPYLVSEPLKPKETGRLEYPELSKTVEPLSKHCLRALKNAMFYGEDGLLILGTGDWNDGIDEAGKKLKGQSVVTSLIFLWAVKEYSDFIEDGNLRTELLQVAERLKAAINKNAYRNGQYFRLRADDGKWYGTGEGALKIDLVSESLAVLSGAADKERADSALDAAKSLVDKEVGIVKLLAPPLGKKNYLGYISKYPKGVRENGGQYTHAAIWYLMALAKAGRPDEAYELFRMINPAEKFRDPEKYARYLGEPFVLSGDVYFSKRNPGRMGWSWYTGSAAWCYHFLCECLFGVRRVGKELEILPNLPACLDGASMIYRFGNSEYRITFKKTGVKKLILDGVSLETGGRIPLYEKRLAEIVAEY